MGLDASRMTCAETVGTQELVETLRTRSGRSGMVMGMGNISGPGFDVVDYFRQRADVGPMNQEGYQEAA
jgi:hypothetical protein